MAHPFVDLVDGEVLPPAPSGVGRRDRWPTARNWLVAVMVALLAFAWFARGRVQVAEDTRERNEFWVEHFDHWSNWFDQYGLPAYEQAQSGVAMEGELITLTADTYQDPGFGFPAPDPAVVVRSNVARWRQLSSPHHQAVLDLVQEWDLGVVGVFFRGGTRIADADGFAAMDGAAFLERLRAAEQAALPAMRRDLDTSVLVHRLWLALMYTSMVLVAVLPFGLIIAGRRLHRDE